jgi:hypothetical protein
MTSETEAAQMNCISGPAPTAAPPSKPTSVWEMTPWQTWLTLWTKSDTNNSAGPVNDGVRYATEDAADDYPGCCDGQASDTDDDAR